MSARPGWLPQDAASSLVRMAFVERALAHIMAGWAVKLPAFEAKQVFGLHMHRAMERASALRGRINGLCHATASVAAVPAGFPAVLVHIDRAQTPARLLIGLYRFVYPRLIALYEAHARQTDPDGDRASVELARTFVAQLKQEMGEGLSLLRRRVRDRTWLGECEALWAARESGEGLALEAALWPPADRVPAAIRPEGVRYSPSGSLGVLPADPLHDGEGIAMFLHKELDEEYTTLELTARNSYEHPGMPWAFHRDMLRQASDEARHAIMIARLMKARGVRHGDFAVTKSSYDGLYAFAPCAPGSRKELLWRMLIRQSFMEGLAIDHLAYEIARRRGAGQTDIATVFEYILRDEVFHAQSGQRWSRELLEHDADAMLAAREEAFAFFAARSEAARERFVTENLDAAMGELAAIAAAREHRGGKPPARPLNRIGRAQAGYSDEDIRQVLRWGFAHDDTGKA